MKPSQEHKASRPGPAKPDLAWLCLFFLATACLLVYANTMEVPWLYDDFMDILANPDIRQLTPIHDVLFSTQGKGTIGRPLVNLSFALNWAFSGPNTVGWHLVNLCIHILAAWFFFGIVRQTLTWPGIRPVFFENRSLLAFFCALLWAVHPLGTSAVTMVFRRPEILCGALYLAVVYLAIRGWKSRNPFWWHLGAIACFILGLGAKEVIVTAPAILLVYDWIFRKTPFNRLLADSKVLYAGMAGGLFVLILLLSASSSLARNTGAERFTMLGYALSQPRILTHYLWLFLWPANLVPDYKWPAVPFLQALPFILLMGSLLAVTIFLCLKRHAAGFIGAWFFLILAPTSSFVPLHYLVAEHRMYLPAQALAALVVLGFFYLAALAAKHGWLKKQNPAVLGSAFFILACLALGLTAFFRNQVYKDPLVFWTDAAQKQPLNEKVFSSLGQIMGEKGNAKAAAAFYKKAVTLNDEYADAHYNLANYLAHMGQINQARGHLQRSLEIRPSFVEAMVNLGNCMDTLGKRDEAIMLYERALAIKPDHRMAMLNMAWMLETRGRSGEALEMYLKAERLAPLDADTHFDVANIYFKKKSPLEAEVHLRKALERDPDFSQARFNLAFTLLKLGRAQQAVEQFRIFLQTDPNYEPAHYNLGLALASLGKKEEAAAHFRKALDLAPDNSSARTRLEELEAPSPGDSSPNTPSLFEPTRAPALQIPRKNTPLWTSGFQAD